MDLVDEEHIVRFQRHQDACQIARLVEHRPGGGLKSDPQLVGYDVGEGGLAEPRRAMQQGVVEGLPSHAGCRHEYAQIVYNLRLTGEVGKGEGAQCLLDVALSAVRLHAVLSYIEIVCHDVDSIGVELL